MKKKALIIVLSIIIAAFASQAQECPKRSYTVALDGGYSISHAPVLGLNFGVNFPTWNIRAGFLAHTSDKVQDGMLPFIKIGHTFDISDRFYVTAAAGYAYSYKSADRKGINKNLVIFSPEIGYKFTLYTIHDETPMAVYLSGTQSYMPKEKSFKDFTIIGAGIRGYF